MRKLSQFKTKKKTKQNYQNILYSYQQERNKTVRPNDKFQLQVFQSQKCFAEIKKQNLITWKIAIKTI